MFLTNTEHMIITIKEKLNKENILLFIYRLFLFAAIFMVLSACIINTFPTLFLKLKPKKLYFIENNNPYNERAYMYVHSTIGDYYEYSYLSREDAIKFCNSKTEYKLGKYDIKYTSKLGLFDVLNTVEFCN